MLGTLLGAQDIMVHKSEHGSYSLVTYSLFGGQGEGGGE